MPGLQRLLGGLAVARSDPLVRYVLVTVFSISFFCLPFIGLMPVVAARDLHINPAGALYGGLYALFGLGAALGAVSVGTVFVDLSRTLLIRSGLARLRRLPGRLRADPRTSGWPTRSCSWSASPTS